MPTDHQSAAPFHRIGPARLLMVLVVLLTVVGVTSAASASAPVVPTFTPLFKTQALTGAGTHGRIGYLYGIGGLTSFEKDTKVTLRCVVGCKGRASTRLRGEPKQTLDLTLHRRITVFAKAVVELQSSLAGHTGRWQRYQLVRKKVRLAGRRITAVIAMTRSHGCLSPRIKHVACRSGDDAASPADTAPVAKDGTTGTQTVPAQPSPTTPVPTTTTPAPTPSPTPSPEPTPTTSTPAPQAVQHYNCPGTANAFGHYVPAGKHWANDFTAQAGTITGGTMQLGAGAGDHFATIGIYTGGPNQLTGALTETTVRVSGYGGVSFTFPQPVAVSAGQYLWFGATGAGSDFTAYDRNDGGADGCVIGTLVGVR